MDDDEKRIFIELNGYDLRISCEIAADSISRNIHEAYGTLGRIVYDDTSGASPERGA